jgi:hypothetical protein
MQSVLGIALLVVGVVLMVFGMQASASLGSRLSEFFTGAPSDRTIWTRVRICAETYGFARQKTRGGSMNLILISWMSFLVDF